MSLNVRDRAVRVATFRFVEVRLMEMLARWTPTTPEMEAKVLFGAHIWEHARHADALGRRTHELRAPLHHSLPPAPEYLRALDLVEALVETPRRIHAFHELLLTGLEARYHGYLRATDALLDAPSLRIVTEILVDIARMREESRELRERMPALRIAGTEWAAEISAAEAAAVELHLPVDRAAEGAGARPAAALKAGAAPRGDQP